LNQIRNCQLNESLWEFKCNLSAFLASFRTSADRLTGAALATKGVSVSAQLKSPNIVLLRNRANCELHGDGALVWPRYKVNLSSSPGGRFYRDRSRWASRWQSRWRPRSLDHIETQLLGWQFDGNTRDLVELCEESLCELETIARSVFQ
jgi:hypothetical protein